MAAVFQILRVEFKNSRINSMYSTYHIIYLCVEDFLDIVCVLLQTHSVQKLLELHSDIASVTLIVLLPVLLLSTFKVAKKWCCQTF